MRIKANADKCQGYGNCVDMDPDHFDVDDDGLVIVLNGAVAESDRESVSGAVRSCPVQAVWLADDDV
jgi:ferredoxin